jgi:glycosyltransferase involved in cell wall biosynthesis
MKLAVSIAGTDRGESGIGTYVREMVPRIARALASRGGTTAVYGTSADLDAYDDVLDGVEPHRLPDVVDAPGASAAYHLGLLPERVRREGSDVLLLPAANRRMPLFARIPMVGVVHDLAQRHVHDKYDPFRMAYFEHVLLPALARAPNLVAVSEATRRDLADALGRDASAIEVVANGVDVERFRAMSTDAARASLAELGLALPERYALYVSRLEAPGKNHVRLVEAFARSERLVGHHLVLAGKDWGAREEILRATERHGVADRVHMLGFVPSEAIAPIMAASELVTMVGLFEGFGLPALEALSMGIPVVASSTGALPEVVGPLGALCHPEDVPSMTHALERAAFDVGLRSRVGAEGPAWAAARSWDGSAEALLASCIAAGEAS